METGKDHKVTAEMEDVVGYLKRTVLGQTTSLTYFTREGEIKQDGNENKELWEQYFKYEEDSSWHAI